MMKKPFTRYSHIQRLGLVLLVALIGFFIARTVARPPSWNDVVWYRSASLIDMKQQPLVYGGNESCKTCHEKETADLAGPGHWKLSCESCHGPLTKHVNHGEKIGDAIVIKESPEQCLNCHSEQISRPENFPQYRYQHGEFKVRRVKSQRGGRSCLDCHKAHSPELHGPLDF